jgi:hypothetical protein
MLWQFQEMGYDYSIFYGGDRLAPKPPRWDYMEQPAREKLNRVMGAMAALRKTDAFRFGSFAHDLDGNGKRMWITHSSMDVVIATNMGVEGFDMAPGFSKAGIWYDYFSGESSNITDPAGHSFYFEPGSYRVFSSEPMPKPFHELTVKVVDKQTLSPISGVYVSLEVGGSRYTDADGNSSFLAFPQSFVVKAEKFSYFPVSTSVTVDGNSSITLEMEFDASDAGEINAQSPIRFYPNPAQRQLTIEKASGYILSIYNLQGRLVLQQQLLTDNENLSLPVLKPGVYILRLSDEQNALTRRLVIH